MLVFEAKEKVLNPQVLGSVFFFFFSCHSLISPLSIKQEEKKEGSWRKAKKTRKIWTRENKKNEKGFS